MLPIVYLAKFIFHICLTLAVRHKNNTKKCIWPIYRFTDAPDFYQMLLIVAVLCINVHKIKTKSSFGIPIPTILEEGKSLIIIIIHIGGGQ